MNSTWFFFFSFFHFWNNYFTSFFTFSNEVPMARLLFGESSRLEGALLGWEKYALSWEGGEPGGVSMSTTPSTGEHGLECRGDSSQGILSFFLWNWRSPKRPTGAVGVLGRSVVMGKGADPDWEHSVEPLDHLKAPSPTLALRSGGEKEDGELESSAWWSTVSLVVPWSLASEDWPNSSEWGASSSFTVDLNSWESATEWSALAKNLNQTPARIVSHYIASDLDIHLRGGGSSAHTTVHLTFACIRVTSIPTVTWVSCQKCQLQQVSLILSLWNCSRK